MACNLAENAPLQRLREVLGLPSQCHSLRPSCVHGYTQTTGQWTMGIPGAVIGYCQALFAQESSALLHTDKVKKLLSEIGAPWANSHELFWGYKTSEEPQDYLEQGMAPLRGNGRVPILITGLDPARDIEQIKQIFETTPAVSPGETILMRIVLNGDDSINRAVNLIRKVLGECRSQRSMPQWWPLLQGGIDCKQWNQLKTQLGDDWKYVNVAVNPFTPHDVVECINNQITVAQVVVGLADGISDDGMIQLAPGMTISGASESDTYSLMEYMQGLGHLPVVPTLIVLGPSQPAWSDELNQRRIAKLIPLLRQGCEILWKSLPKERQEYVWRLSA